MDTSSVSAILERMTKPEVGGLSREFAESILRFEFTEQEHLRMRNLAERSNAGTFTPDEKGELMRYTSVCAFVALIQSKASNSLTQLPGQSPSG